MMPAILEFPNRLIGVVPQDLAIYDDLTARENLSFWGQMYGLSGKLLRARSEVLELIGLSDKANKRIETYCGGMKRRVNIGVGLLHRPRLLVSPTSTFQVRSGKVLGIYLAGVAQMLILILASMLLFQLNWGDLLGVLVLAAVAGAAGWGMLITALARTPGQVRSVTRRSC
jgi:hypothetical protein